MLGKLLPDFDLSIAIDRSTWAVITTAVHGLCRLGELAPETHAGKFYPRRKDYSLSAEGRANIFIARSKTDVNHEGFHLPIPRNGTATCPIVRSSKRSRQAPPGGCIRPPKIHCSRIHPTGQCSSIT